LSRSPKIRRGAPDGKVIATRLFSPRKGKMQTLRGKRGDWKENGKRLLPRISKRENPDKPGKEV